MSFLQAWKEEWSLVRRHPSERIFGMQIAGSKPQLLVPAAEIIGRECAGNLDFVDLNCGCPIDLVYKTGSGSACTYLLALNEGELSGWADWLRCGYDQCSTQQEGWGRSWWG